MNSASGKDRVFGLKLKHMNWKETSLISLLLLTLSVCNGQGSHDPQQIVLDFKTKRFVSDSSAEQLNKIRRGEYYQISISNINLNLYDVKIDKVDSTLSSSVSFPSFEALGIDPIKMLIGSLSSSPETALLAPKTADTIAQARSELITLLAITKTLQVESGELIKLFNAKKLDYLKAYTPLHSTPPYAPYSLDQLLEKADTLQANIRKNRLQLISAQARYEKFSTENLPDIQQNEILKKQDEALKSAFQDGVALASQVYDSVNPEKISEMASALLVMSINASGRYTSLPFQFGKDLNTIKISIEPKSKEQALPGYHTEIHFPNTVMYSGMGVSIYYAGFQSDSYSVVESREDTVSSYAIARKGSTMGEIGLAALLHVGFRPFNNFIGFQLSMGPALSFAENARGRLASGFGMSIGRKNMLSFNALYMAGYVDRLSQAYQEGQSYTTPPADITRTQLAGSWSLAMGYIYKF